MHARLKNEFMEDEKYHNLITWLHFFLFAPTGVIYSYEVCQCSCAPVVCTECFVVGQWLGPDSTYGLVVLGEISLQHRLSQLS